MPNKEDIKKYYKEAELVLKPQSNWRLYKLQLLSGRWINVKKQINTPEQLRKVLIKEAPLNVFSSTSSWLNPLNVEKPSYKDADRILLNNLVFIDIDSHNLNVLNAVLEFFEKKPRYKIWKAKDSGNGYGVYYIDTYSIKEPNLRKRIRKLKLERLMLVMEMAKSGITDFDWRMVIDPFRVSRVMGTLNEGEKICKEITYPLVSIEESPERPEKADEGEEESFRNPTTKYRTSEPTGLGASSTYYYPFIDSQIYGIKGKHCVHIVKRKEYNYNRFIKLLIKLQNVYKLTDFYIFETNRHYVALCLKGVDERRFIKILKAAKASNLNPFVKYVHSWIKTGRSIGNMGDIIEEPPIFKAIVENNEHAQDYHSTPHLNYLNKIGIVTKKYTNLFGIERNPKMLAQVRI